MIQKETVLAVADNTGAKRVRCFGILGGSKRRYAFEGDVLIASVIDTIPNSQTKKKTIVKALVVRSKKGGVRKDGSKVEFEENAVVILNEKLEPRGTSIQGPVSRLIDRKKFGKILSLAKEVI